MARYTGRQSILDEALGEYADYGFNLKEPDDHITELYFKDKCIGRYNRTKVTFETLREDCGNFLKSIARQYDD